MSRVGSAAQPKIMKQVAGQLNNTSTAFNPEPGDTQAGEAIGERPDRGAYVPVVAGSSLPKMCGILSDAPSYRSVVEAARRHRQTALPDYRIFVRFMALHP